MKTYKVSDKNLKNRTDMSEIVEECGEKCTTLCGSTATRGNSAVTLGNNASVDNTNGVSEISTPSELHSNDVKTCGKRVKIGAEIGIKGLVTAQFEYLKEQYGSDNNAKGGEVLTGGLTKFCGETGSCYKGSMWSVFTQTLYDDDRKVIGVATAVVDGEKVKPNVWYRVVNGEFVEANDTVKILPEYGITA